MDIIFSKRCLDYKFEGHPESPERVENIRDTLKQSGYKFKEAEPAGRNDVLLAHTEEHYDRIVSKNYFDPDTPRLDACYPLLSAGCAMEAAKIRGFALTRPPGHHAGRNFLGGFCYFNNMAIAAKSTGRRAAVLDLDVHHGNGTQNILLGDDKALFVSIHQSPLYPHTGQRSESNCMNYPMPPGTGETPYLKVLRKAVKSVENFKPELLGVSMGFDTYRSDPLGNFELKEESYKKIGEIIKELNIPCFVVLEGGYDANKIGTLCSKLLDALE